MTNNFDDLYGLAINKTLPVNLEKLVYYYANSFGNGNYKGGNWISQKIFNTNFWYFSLDENNLTYKIDNYNTQSTLNVTANFFSLLCFTFALNNFLANYYEENEDILFLELHDLYYGIINNIDKILDKNESRFFLAFID